MRPQLHYRTSLPSSAWERGSRSSASLLRIFPAFGLATLLLFIAGCSKGHQKYIPASETARQALDTALAAWKDGQKLGTIEAFSPPIHVLDSRWLQGRVLREYQILGEVHQDDGPRCFTVQLLLDGPRQEEKVRYYVAGIEPLWVFRQEDFDMINHWACNEPDAKPAPKAGIRNQETGIRSTLSNP